MECSCYLRNVQDLLADGKLPMKDDSENNQKKNNSLWEQRLNITRFQHDINQDFIHLVRKFYLESFLGVH